jgi:3-polyprenyl-4-hydroxybenzoate decarboxylase
MLSITLWQVKPIEQRVSRLTSAATMGDVLDYASREIASGSTPGIDATKRWPGEGFKSPGHLVGTRLLESEGPRSSN